MRYEKPRVMNRKQGSELTRGSELEISNRTARLKSRARAISIIARQKVHTSRRAARIIRAAEPVSKERIAWKMPSVLGWGRIFFAADLQAQNPDCLPHLFCRSAQYHIQRKNHRHYRPLSNRRNYRSDYEKKICHSDKIVSSLLKWKKTEKILRS